MNMPIDQLRRLYGLLAAASSALQSPFLLVLRLYFFWQLFLTGKGKLLNIGKASEFFASLGIPLPTVNAYFIGSLECFGSLLLMVGLASRPLSLLIVVSMAVAYFTADFEALSNTLSDPDKFVKADPFPFLFAALIVLVFGPGKFSLDAFLDRRLQRRSEGRPIAADPKGAPAGRGNINV
ncbi:MAG TPA: DoxX family protein [Chthoniobacterales bacterium]